MENYPNAITQDMLDAPGGPYARMWHDYITALAAAPAPSGGPTGFDATYAILDEALPYPGEWIPAYEFGEVYASIDAGFTHPNCRTDEDVMRPIVEAAMVAEGLARPRPVQRLRKGGRS